MCSRPARHFESKYVLTPQLITLRHTYDSLDIITNRICDQISTVCGANAPAKILCRESQAKIRALGTRDKSTADTWNTLVGFGGALTNPDGGLSGLGAGELKKRETEDMKKRAPLIACSTEIWIDTCTGWPAPEPVVKKRSEDVAPIVEKRDASPAANPFAKRSEKTKRQRPFVACSAEEWIDTCTGWP